MDYWIIAAVFILLVFMLSWFEYGCILECMQINLCRSWKPHCKPQHLSLSDNFCRAYCCWNIKSYLCDNHRSQSVKMSISLVMVRVPMCHLELFMPQQKGAASWWEHFLSCVHCVPSFSVKFKCHRHSVQFRHTKQQKPFQRIFFSDYFIQCVNYTV